MKNAVLTLLLLLAIPCLAKVKITNTSTDAACPVKITEAFVWTSHDIQRRFEIDYTNQSSQVIMGANFGLDVMDGVGDFRPYLTDYTVGTTTKVGKKNFNNFFAFYTEYDAKVLGTRLWVKKVAFADGTSWVDDGTKKCQYVKDNR